MAVWDFVDYQLRILARATALLKVMNLVGGGLLAASSYYQGQAPAVSWVASPLFWSGLVVFISASLLQLLFEQSPADQLKALHSAEAAIAELEDEFKGSEVGRELFSSWLALTKLLQEVVDQALAAERISEEDKANLFRMAVEFIADYKLRLFGLADDYMNISVYEYVEPENLLKCIACFRSRPSDAVGPHRSWAPGSGHVGKAFEMKRELICGDATHPDVASWIAAPPENFKDEDVELYVSLASIPIALRAAEPLGVLIMTSDQPNRFKNGADDDTDGDPVPKIAVNALQDVASQLAQLLHLAQSKNHEPEASHDR